MEKIPPQLHDREPFFRKVVEHDGSSSLLFASQYLIDKAVAGVTEMHVDGTFKIVPTAPAAHQLLTVHCVVLSKIIPIAFCLMSNRRRLAYDNVFAAIRVLAPTLVPNIIITDYERALQLSLSSVFPNARINGCFYHYASAVWKKSAALQFLPIMRENPLYRKAVKMLMALPLLPAANVVTGLNEIEEWCNREQIDIVTLFQYMRRYWIRTITPDAMSVFLYPHRTNNNVESFNKALLDKIGPHPNVFVFIEKLIQMSESALLNYTRLVNGLRISRPVASRYLLNDIRIKDAQHNPENGLLSIFHFLEIVCHSVDRIEQRLDNIQQHIQPIVDEPDDVVEQPDEPRPRLPSPMPHLLSPELLPAPLPILPLPAPLPFLPVPVPRLPSPIPMFELPHYVQMLISDSSSSSEEDNLTIGLEQPEVRNDDNGGDEEFIDEAIFHLPEDDFETLPDEVFFEDDDSFIDRWTPQVIDEDEENVPQSLICNICLTRRKLYSLQCGHLYGGTCAEIIFNRISAKCPECRVHLYEEPRRIFL